MMDLSKMTVGQMKSALNHPAQHTNGSVISNTPSTELWENIGSYFADVDDEKTMPEENRFFDQDCPGRIYFNDGHVIEYMVSAATGTWIIDNSKHTQNG